jgi:SAM-dependent methyltransferase
MEKVMSFIIRVHTKTTTMTSDEDDERNTKLFSPCQEQLASSLTMSRPELTGHASLFYNAKEARKYDSSSRMIGVQREITERAIELLRLPEDKPCFVLDIGCGSGLSGHVLEEHGHAWVGCDVSRDMLTVANERISVKREERGTGRMKDEDEEDDEEDSHEGPSTGDLMHHVSLLSYRI